MNNTAPSTVKVTGLAAKLRALKVTLLDMHHDSVFKSIDITKNDDDVDDGPLFFHFSLLVDHGGLDFAVKADDIAKEVDMHKLAEIMVTRKDTRKEERRAELKRKLGSNMVNIRTTEDKLKEIETGIFIEMMRKRVQKLRDDRATMEKEVSAIERDLGLA
jgi:hypothetical protein